MGGVPEYFIVPSKEVSQYVTNSHANWLSTPGKHGQQHQDSNVRKFVDREGEYLGRWELLGL